MGFKDWGRSPSKLSQDSDASLISMNIDVDAILPSPSDHSACRVKMAMKGIRAAAKRTMSKSAEIAGCLHGQAPYTPTVPGDPLNGVSVHYLAHEFVHLAEELGFSRDSSIHEIEPLLVRRNSSRELDPRDGRRGSAFIDTLSGADKVGRANVMLSYTWSYTLGEVVDSLTEYCSSRSLNPRKTYVWICFLCINQHRVQEAVDAGETVPFEQFAEEFSHRVRSIGHILALIGSWREPKYVTRAWCIYELYVAIAEGCRLEIIMPSVQSQDFLKALHGDEKDCEEMWHSIQSANVEKAEASIASDKENILRLVEQGPGVATLNQTVRRKLQLWFCDVAESAARRLQQERNFCSWTAQEMGKVSFKIGKLLVDFFELSRLEKIAEDWIAVLRNKGCTSSCLYGWFVCQRSYARLWLGGQVCKEDLEEAYSLAIKHKERHLEMKVLFIWGVHLASKGQVKEGIRKLEQAALITDIICEWKEVSLVSWLGLLHSMHRKCGIETQKMDEVKRVLTKSGALRSPCNASMLMHLAYLHAVRGEMDAANETCSVAWQILTDTGSLHTTLGAGCAAVKGWILAKSGNVDEGLRLCTNAYDELCKSGQLKTTYGVYSIGALAYVKDLRGDIEGVRSLQQQAHFFMHALGVVPILQLGPEDFYEELTGCECDSDAGDDKLEFIEAPVKQLPVDYHLSCRCSNAQEDDQCGPLVTV